MSQGKKIRTMTAQKKKQGIITSVNVSEETGVAKTSIDRTRVIRDHGLESDAHAGKWHRQVSLLADESIQTMKEKGLDVQPGAFGENLTTTGIELSILPVGQRLKVGDSVILEVTQIGKECTSPCSIYYKVGDCIMPREGIFAAVIEEGEIAVGDRVELIS